MLHSRLAAAAALMLVVWSSAALAQDPPEGVWTLEGFSRPESVYYDATSKTLFVSNLVGSGAEKDGEGWISKVSTDGKLIELKWVQGLNAPKGLRSHDGVLWVSDIDRLVSIDIASGKIRETIEVADAEGLNDVAIAGDGTVYVSDKPGNKIFEVREGKVGVFAEGPQLESPNGLAMHGSQLVVGGWGNEPADKTSAVKPAGRLYALDRTTKERETITRQPVGNLDGIELDGSGGHFVSDWVAGQVYRISAGGQADVVLSGFKGAADIGVVPEKELLIVPQMLEDRITAYDIGSL